MGVYQRKFSSPAHRGVPDRMVLHGGRAYFVEFKSPGEVPTKLQQHEMDLLRRAGCPCYWTDNWVKAQTILDRIVSVKP
jgi:hypothetical protein